MQEASPELPGQPKKHTYCIVKCDSHLLTLPACLPACHRSGRRKADLSRPPSAYFYSADDWCHDTWIWDNDRGRAGHGNNLFHTLQQVGVRIDRRCRDRRGRNTPTIILLFVFSPGAFVFHEVGSSFVNFLSSFFFLNLIGVLMRFFRTSLCCFHNMSLVGLLKQLVSYFETLQCRIFFFFGVIQIKYGLIFNYASAKKLVGVTCVCSSCCFSVSAWTCPWNSVNLGSGRKARCWHSCWVECPAMPSNCHLSLPFAASSPPYCTCFCREVFQDVCLELLAVSFVHERLQFLKLWN